ncbi:MAG: NAD(P)/FAD-dependent oxidoreductase [Betaproteobacteria bacterium]
MTHDLIVIGAGPAGMAAATMGATLGLQTVLLDEQPQSGGQIYRNVATVHPAVARLLGPDYLHGASLVEAMISAGVDVRHDALAWDVSRDLKVTAFAKGTALQFKAPQIIAASGALERASPIPGWTLPGVMNVGAAQIALKSSGSVPSGRTILAGGGPLLYLVACQLLDAGANIAAIVETSSASNRIAALKHLPRALGAVEYLIKGVKMMARLRRAGVPWFKNASALSVTGNVQAEGLSFDVAGTRHTIAADLVLLHHGVIPNTQISRLMRVDHVWSDAQRAFNVVCDAYGQTSMPGFRIAGDGAAIGGAHAAQNSGALAALGAAVELGKLSRSDFDRYVIPYHRARDRDLRVRPFLDVLYSPPADITDPVDEAIVCRCEEVTAGRIREMASLGCQGPNQTKFFSRCGMGPCQGRVCGGVVTQILAKELGKTPGEIGAYRIRAPLKPVPVAAFSGLAESSDESIWH